MKKHRSLQIVVLFGIIATLLLTAAAPLPAQFVSAANQDLIRLTIKNKNSSPVSMKLEGPGYYYFSVQAESTAVFTVERGAYTSTIYACGATTRDNDIDLSRQKTLVMPICGGNAGPTAQKVTKVDLSQFVKVVPVTLENDSNTNMIMILTGPSTYVFSFKKGESKDYTIVRGEYDLKYYACGTYKTRTWYVHKGSELTLECP